MLKLNKIQLRPTDKQKQMIIDLMEEKGFRSAVSTIEFCIAESHKREFPAYVRAKMNPEDPVEAERVKIEKREAADKARQEAEEAKAMVFANKLDAEVYEDGDKKMVRYYTYDNKNRYEQVVPLIYLSQDDVDQQYTPSKKKVLQYQKEGKVKYEID